MTGSINKVVVLKITPNNNEILDKFNKSFNQTFKVTQQIFNEVVCWGNDYVYTKESIVIDLNGNKNFIPKDLKAARKVLYDYTDKSVTYEQFEKMLKVMYLAFVNSSQSRSMVSSIIGEPNSDENITSVDDWKKIDTIVANWDDDTVDKNTIVYNIANTLKNIGFRNRTPYTIELSPGERYSVMANVHRMLTSWKACDEEKSKTYKEEEAEIEKAYSEIDVSIVEDIGGFFEYCTKNNIIKDFNPRVHAYLRDCLIPSLKENKTPTEHFYLHRGEKINYSLHDGFFNYLKDHPSLWNTEKPIILEKIHILEMIMSHNNHHPNAFYPFIEDDDTKRFQYIFGDNYTKYDFEKKGDALADTEVQVGTTNYNFANGCKISDIFINFSRSREDKETISFRIHTKDKYVFGKIKPNSYFNDLSVWSNNTYVKKEADKYVKTNRCTNLFQFSRKGKVVQALIKEPSIVKIHGYYAIRLNMTVITKNDNSLNKDLKWYLSTALPIANSKRSAIKDTPSNIIRFKNLNNRTFNFLGIDLGQRTPFSWAVGKSTITGPINKLEILKIGEYEVTNNNDYWNLLNDIHGFSKIIGITKSLYKGNDCNLNHDFIKQTIEHAINYLKEHNCGNSDKQQTLNRFFNDPDHFKTLKDQLAASNNDLAILKKNPNFIGTIIIKYLNLRFNELKNARKFHLRNNDISTKLNQEFKWLKIIEGMKRCCRSVSYLGTDNTRKPINLDSLNDYFKGCKDNLLKVIASNIVDIAMKNNCKIIVMESLNPNATRASLNKRNENFLQSLWSPARIQGAIENAANWHGIEIAEVSESQTSQVHFETQTYGYRKGTSLYYMQNGELKETHADMNAAKNIIYKFVTRHASTTQFSIEQINNLNQTNESDDESKNKRLRSLLTHHFGTISEAQEYFKKNFSGVEFVYLNNKKWISKEKKETIQDDIKVLVEAKEVKVDKDQMISYKQFSQTFAT
jgi:IS605 OrfB family transposase